MIPKNSISFHPFLVMGSGQQDSGLHHHTPTEHLPPQIDFRPQGLTEDPSVCLVLSSYGDHEVCTAGRHLAWPCSEQANIGRGLEEWDKDTLAERAP